MRRPTRLQPEPTHTGSDTIQWSTRFSAATRLMTRSTVRDLLKVATRSEMISFAGGLPAPELFPVDALRSAADSVLVRRGSQALQYGETEGLPALREWIAAYVSTHSHVIPAENVLITHGAQQGLDLLGRILFNRGDQVIVENPTYLAALASWRPLEAQWIAAPADEDGLIVEHLESIPDAASAKALYTVPNFQNPQGVTLSHQRRRRLVEWVRAHGVALIEDDPYGELRFEGGPIPSLHSIDAQERRHSGASGAVISLGTFSKTLAPGLRLGWVVAPKPVIDQLALAKQAADLHTSTLNQEIALELLENGILATQLPRLREAYRLRRDTMIAAIRRWFPCGTTCTRPAGGMFLMVRLPAGLDAATLLPRALESNVAFVPGDAFHLGPGAENTLRLNYSHATPDRIETGIRRLAEVVKTALDRHATCLPTGHATGACATVGGCTST